MVVRAFKTNAKFSLATSLWQSHAASNVGKYRQNKALNLQCSPAAEQRENVGGVAGLQHVELPFEGGRRSARRQRADDALFDNGGVVQNEESVGKPGEGEEGEEGWRVRRDGG